MVKTSGSLLHYSCSIAHLEPQQLAIMMAGMQCARQCAKGFTNLTLFNTHNSFVLLAPLFT